MVDLEERTIESLPDRCQSCGTKLTDAEKQTILDEGSELALCTVCAAEAEPAVEPTEDPAETP
jgi:ribosome-binding protein aMBF1 (putative translation factor)